MREPLAVRRLQPERDAVDEARDALGGQRAALRAQLRERAALDPLHDDERASGLRSVVDDLHDPRVPELRGLVRAARERERVDVAEELEREAAAAAIVSRLVHPAVAS